MNQGLPLLTQSDPNDALPNITSALAWRGWSEGLDEARHRGIPILALAEPSWTNSAQRLAFIIEQDEDLRNLLTDHVVPVLLDPVQRPDLAARWSWASITLTGTSGPPLLILLTHEGLPFLSYCSMWPEGRKPHPSLASLIRATAEAYANGSDAFVDEARNLDNRARQADAPTHDSAQALWQSLAAEIDKDRGGFQENPKHPHPQFLWLLLETSAGDDASAPNPPDFVATTLRNMLRGGIHDQLAEGFHRCSRDERWIVPHFEKPLPLNAQLAALYAKAAREFGDDGFRDVANSIAKFCLPGLRDSIDAVGSDGPYYTWTTREVQDTLDTAYVQAISFYYHLTRHQSRHVLYRAIEPEAMDRYSHESPDTLRKRIKAGRRQLLMARNRRPPPELVRLPTLSWPAQTIRWLFTAAEQGCDVPLKVLEGTLERVIADHFHDNLGYRRTGHNGDQPQAWLEDQAAILAAMLAAYRATEAVKWREWAQQLADVILDRYAHDNSWLDQPHDSANAQPSRAITDDVLPSAIATLTDALVELGTLLNDDRYAHVARHAAASHLPSAHPCAQWAGAMWRAWFQLSREQS